MKKVLVINFLVLLVGLMAIELTFGSWLKDHNYGYSNLPRDLKIVSDTNGLYKDGGSVTYSRDSNGFRGTYQSPDTIDFLVLGGSTTNEMYIDDCCTWPALIAQKAKADGHDISVVNAGIDGQSTVGHIWNFDAWFPNVKDLSPKYIISYIGINERAFGGNSENIDKQHHNDTTRQIRQYVKNNSAIFHLLKTIAGTVAAQRENLTHHKIDYPTVQWSAMPIADYQAKSCNVDSQASYKARLEVLHEKILSYNAVPIYATQTRGDSYIKDGQIFWLKDMDALTPRHLLDCFNQVTLEFCAEKSAKCVDVANADFDHTMHFYDLVHTTPLGSEMVADTFYQNLKPEIENIR